MTDIQLYIAIGLPVIAVLTSLTISLVQISAIRDDVKEVRADMREIDVAANVRRIKYHQGQGELLYAKKSKNSNTRNNPHPHGDDDPEWGHLSAIRTAGNHHHKWTPPAFRLTGYDVSHIEDDRWSGDDRGHNRPGTH